MNEDLKKNVTKENELLEQLTNDYNALIVTIPPHLRECFKEKFTKRGRGFKQCYTSEKVKRFERIVNPRQNNKKITKSKPSETFNIII